MIHGRKVYEEAEPGRYTSTVYNVDRAQVEETVIVMEVLLEKLHVI
jgi:hypothetical protein